jgi:centrin-1
MHGRSGFGVNRANHTTVGRRHNQGYTLTEAQMEELKEAFALFDNERTGTLDVRELRAAMRAIGAELTKDQLKNVLTSIGKDATQASTRITFDEYIALCTPRMANRDSREEIAKIFQLFDEDNTGYITFRTLKKVCQELGEQLTDEEIQEMIDEADRDADGKVNFEEFFRVMKKRSENPLDDWDSDED